MAGAQSKQVVEDELRRRLIAHGDGERERSLCNAVNETRENVIGEGDLNLREILATPVAVVQREGHRLAAVGAFTHLKF